MSTQYYTSDKPLKLENGDTFESITLGYHTYGTLNPAKDNVIWVCHALTASSEVEEWWPGLVGPGKCIDTDRYFIVCANMLGSVYGSTSPSSINPKTGSAYKDSFPLISIKDMVASYQMLAEHLDIDQIYCCIGGSTGGMQVVEWSIIEPQRFEHAVMIACDSRFSPWGIAFNQSQRMALLSDKSIYDDTDDAGLVGLAAARTIALLSYRHYDVYESTQTNEDDRLDDFKASSYQNHQGSKFRKRFEPWSYWSLTRSMDSHNVGRGRKSVIDALGTIKANTIIIGIDRDILFPFQEQEFLNRHINGSRLYQINSKYGHDAFLIEYDQLIEALSPVFLEK